MIDEKPMIGSHTMTEFGIYDAEPFPVEGNAYYWYIRAVYWKRESGRKEGVQSTIDFEQKSCPDHAYSTYTYGEGVSLSPLDMGIVKNYLNLNGPGFGNKINAIKHVRTVTGCGLKEAKDFVDAL